MHRQYYPLIPLTSANCILNYPVWFTPFHLLSFSGCPLSLRFPLSHSVSVNLIYPSLVWLFPPSLAGLPPSCPPSPSVLQSLHLFSPWNGAVSCTELWLSVCGWRLHWFSLLSWAVGHIYSRDVSTWQEGSLSSLHCYLPEVAVAHFKASTNPSPPPQKPHSDLQELPKALLKSSSACLSPSSAFEIQ